MFRPTLSICIPTYNRSRCLQARLEQLEKLLSGPEGDRVELLVSNNGSPDDTADVALSFQYRIRHFRYLSHQLNYGADYNFINCMVNATGEYVWIFSDDDEFLENSVKDALSLIDSKVAELIVCNQQIGDSYTCREALGARMFDIDSDWRGTLRDITNSFGFLSTLGFVTALIFKKPQLSTMDWVRHQNYETALVHATVLFEVFHQKASVVTAQTLLKVEPPVEHQTREHQISQDPRVNFRQWTLNLSTFFVDMYQRGHLTGEESPKFYEVKHCAMSIASHIVGSFKTTISELREIPEVSWSKIGRFLEMLNDHDNLAYLGKLRNAQNELLKDILRLRADQQVRDHLLHQLAHL